MDNVRVNDKKEAELSVADIQYPLVFTLPNFETMRIHDAETFDKLKAIVDRVNTLKQVI